MIIFLYGEDTFRSRRKLNELKDKFLRDVDPNGTSLQVVDGEVARIEEIGELVGPASLFSRKRMIVIEHIFNNKDQTIFEELFAYLKNKGIADNIIIFWDSLFAIVAGVRIGSCVYFEPGRDVLRKNRYMKPCGFREKRAGVSSAWSIIPIPPWKTILHVSTTIRL